MKILSIAALALLASVSLRAQIVAAPEAKPAPIPPQALRCAMTWNDGSTYSFILQNNNNGTWQATYTEKKAGEAERVLWLGQSGDGHNGHRYPLRCKFGLTNALLFQCSGGSKMGPEHAKSYKITEEYLALDKEITNRELKIEIFEAWPYNKPTTKDHGAKVSFAPEQCHIER